jgi:hypothetical protein
MSSCVFNTKWIPGKLNIEVDVFSRFPVSHGSVADELGEGSSIFTARPAVVDIITGSASTAILLRMIPISSTLFFSHSPVVKFHPANELR